MMKNSSFDGRPATWGKGKDVAFLAETAEEVSAFYAAALESGGSDEGPPGIRDGYGPDYSAAYVRGPDGNRLQVVCYVSA